MDKTFISGAEICKIIESCAKKGVLELKYGPLHLKFAGKTQESTARGPKIPTESAPENIIQAQNKEQEEALFREELKTRDEQIAELIVTDPLLAEELMAEGELEESNDGPNDG